MRKLLGAGLRLFRRRSSDGKMVVLLTASQERLESEAELRRISLRRAQTAGESGARPSFDNFTVAQKEEFELKNDELFSPLERQRLVLDICEGAEFRGGAELDLDALVIEDIFCTYMPLHSSERESIWASWGGLRLACGGWPHGAPYRQAYAAAAGRWPLVESAGQPRCFPDLGLTEQPIHAVKVRCVHSRVRSLLATRAIVSPAMRGPGHRSPPHLPWIHRPTSGAR